MLDMLFLIPVSRRLLVESYILAKLNGEFPSHCTDIFFDTHTCQYTLSGKCKLWTQAEFNVFIKHISLSTTFTELHLGEVGTSIP